MAKLESMPPVWECGIKKRFFGVFFIYSKTRSIYSEKNKIEVLGAFLFVVVIGNFHTAIVSS